MATMTKTIPYKDSTVYIAETEADFSTREKPPVCWCCMHNVNRGKAIMLFNNFKHFPNMVMHEKCFDSVKHNTDELFEAIEKDYNEYKTLNIIFGR